MEKFSKTPLLLLVAWYYLLKLAEPFHPGEKQLPPLDFNNQYDAEIL